MRQTTREWQLLQRLNACVPAMDWLEELDTDDPAAAWAACNRPEWLLWLAEEVGLPAPAFTALCRVIRRAGELPPAVAAVVAAIESMLGDGDFVSIDMAVAACLGVPRTAIADTNARYSASWRAVGQVRLAAAVRAAWLAAHRECSCSYAAFLAASCASDGEEACPELAAVVREVIPFEDIRAAADAIATRCGIAG